MLKLCYALVLSVFLFSCSDNPTASKIDLPATINTSLPVEWLDKYTKHIYDVRSNTTGMLAIKSAPNDIAGIIREAETRYNYKFMNEYIVHNGIILIPIDAGFTDDYKKYLNCLIVIIKPMKACLMAMSKT